MRFRLAAMAVILLATQAAATDVAPREFPAVLAGHAVLPANTFLAAPTEASADLRVSGKFTSGQRVEALGTVPGLSVGRPTGLSLPSQGHSVQGHSVQGHSV